MIKRTLYRAAAATVLGLSLTTGIVAADSSSISYTGQNSKNWIHTRVTDNSKVITKTDVSADVNNTQSAYTGDAKSYGNTKGGVVQTGNASNTSNVGVTVKVPTVSTGGSGGGSMWPSSTNSSIDTTGQNSDNHISNSYTDNSKVITKTDIDLSVDNHQTASSGDATSTGNTVGGGVSTGNATNTSTVTFNVGS